MSPTCGPSYLVRLASGELERRAAAAAERLRACTLCGHRCGADRTAGEQGKCRTGTRAVVASWGPHFGEERPLVGRGGSGTVFFAGCNLRCVFCQNWEISQELQGVQVEPEQLARIFLALQEQGCHNVNLVSPTHVVAPVLAAVAIAAPRGLRLPLVYNTGGYDGTEVLALLDGVVDIYMPDMKYADERAAVRFSSAPEYTAVNQAAVLEMHRQVGDLVLDDDGVAQRGLLVRHLVLPRNLAGTDLVLRFLAEHVSRDTYLNLMDQYRPCYRSYRIPALDRMITPREYHEAVAQAQQLGLWRIDGLEREAARR